MDYAGTKTGAIERKKELSIRLAGIAGERARLDEEERTIRRELTGLDQILEGIEVMEGDDEPEPAGMTEHIRRILQATTVPLLPTQIRDSVKTVGITGSSEKNLLIAVHTVLRRLGDFLEETKVDGKTAYRWKGHPLDKLRAPYKGGRVYKSTPGETPGETTLRNLADLMDTRTKK